MDRQSTQALSLGAFSVELNLCLEHDKIINMNIGFACQRGDGME